MLSAAGQAVTTTVDSASGGAYARRLVSQGGAPARPSTIIVTAADERVTWTMLAAAGAEPGDTAWSFTGFTADTGQRFVGRASYRGTGSSEMRSTPFSVPAQFDTISVTFWTRFSGDGYSETPFGFVRVSTDSGQTWSLVARLAGGAALWYPEDVRIGGVRGRRVMLSFVTANLPWWIDEVSVFANGARFALPGGGGDSARLAPSANPVRGVSVTFTWPWVGRSGRLNVYDLTGRLVWTRAVAAGAADVRWELAPRVPNGVYLVLAESEGARARLKLFVARENP